MVPTTKGLTFAQLAISLAATRNQFSTAYNFACNRWGVGTPVANILNKAIPSAGLDEQNLPYRSAASEFFDTVAERALPLRLNLRRVPNGIRLLMLSSGSTAHWVGEGKGKPVSKPVFAPASFRPKKIVSLSVFTDELVGSTDVYSEALIRRDMIAAASVAISEAFIDPNNAGDDATPSSITNGVSPLTSSGDPTGDIGLLLANFSGDLERAAWIMSPFAAAQLSGANHPDVGLRGGSLLGAPLVVSTAAGAVVALVDVDRVALVEGVSGLTTSTQASVEMEAAPVQDSVTPTASSQVNLWQTNSVAVLSEQQINWQRVGDAVAWLDAAWAAPGT